MNWWLLWATGVVLRRPTRGLVICLVAALGGLCSFLWLLVPVTLAREFFFKSIVALAMVHLCFLPERVGALIKLTGVFTLLSAVLAGITYALALTGTYKTGQALPRIGWYLVLGGPLIMTLPIKSLWAAVSNYFRASHESTLLRYAVGGIVVEQDAALDTGNSLYEPLSHRPVVVVDLESVSDRLPPSLLTAITIWNETGSDCLDTLPDAYLERISLIPFSTVGGGGLMMGVRPEICELWAAGTWHKVDAVIGFAPGQAKLGGKTALLPYTVWPVEI